MITVIMTGLAQRKIWFLQETRNKPRCVSQLTRLNVCRVEISGGRFFSFFSPPQAVCSAYSAILLIQSTTAATTSFFLLPSSSSSITVSKLSLLSRSLHAMVASTYTTVALASPSLI